MDDRSLLPRTVQNRRQNIPDTSAATLQCGVTAHETVTGGGAQTSNRAELSTLTFHCPFHKKRTNIIRSIFGHFLLDVSFEFWVRLHRLKHLERCRINDPATLGALRSSILTLESTDEGQTYAMFLDGHISEVDKHVVQLTGAGCVLDRAEPAEAQLVPKG